jgi:hypothetical protein
MVRKKEAIIQPTVAKLAHSAMRLLLGCRATTIQAFNSEPGTSLSDKLAISFCTDDIYISDLLADVVCVA